MCRERGLRVTPQRTEVFRELISTDDHPDAETLRNRVQKRLPNISLDTVYRILYWLEQQNLVRRVHVASERLRFDGNAGSHHHFVCSTCGVIRDFTSSDIEEVELPEEVESWGRIDDRQLQVFGTCRSCMSSRKRRRRVSR